MIPQETLLDVQNLTVTAHARSAKNSEKTVLVKNFSLKMVKGERVGLIGESGSGKSMTITSLMGLLPGNVTATGQVNFAGHTGNLLQANEKQLMRLRGRDMAMVFQEPLTALNPLMRAGTQVAEIIVQHGLAPSKTVAAKRAVEMLDAVHLPEPAQAARAYPHQLSGGQRQRVMLAMALANNPALLLADEPTTALDVTVQRQVLDLMLELVRERGTGLLFITHDLAVVANMCERVLVMNNGEIVEQGSTQEIFTNPKHPYTRGLLAASDLDAVDENGRLYTVQTAAGYMPGKTAKTPAGGSNIRSENKLVQVKDLVRTFTRGKTSLLQPAPRVRALKGISFTVPEGGRMGVVGESGSGKSTLLRILAGLDQPTSGSVIVAGNEVKGAREKQLLQLRQNLQIVFQDPMGSLDPRMSVAQIVSEPLLVPGRKENAEIRHEMVCEMLERVGLEPAHAARYPHEFSGGQRQRISIARALICRPRVVVADEPVSALDVSVRAQVLNLLAELVDEYGLTLVFVSHDLHVVRHLCDTVIVMQSGEIVEAGATETVYTNPGHPYTKKLIDSSLSLVGEMQTRS